MKSKESRMIRRKLIVSRITSTISLTLVMFMLGVIGYLLLNARQISILLKENIGITLMLKDTAKDTEVETLQKQISGLSYVKTVTYISKEKAAQELKEEVGQDFLDFLGYNPLPAALEVKVKADYSHPDSMARVAAAFQKHKEVSEVVYQKDLVQMLSENVRKLSFIFLIFSGLLITIAVSIINNSVRLTVYSKRFLLKTMQLVGATPSFIRKPFLKQSIWLGMLGSTLANILLAGLSWWAKNQVDGLIGLNDYHMMGILFLAVLISGISLHLLFTWSSINKYLHTREEHLYY